MNNDAAARAAGYEEIFEKYPMRFSSAQKTALLADAKRRFIDAGWNEDEISIEETKGMLSSRNLVVGDPSAPYVVTAHYDTPASNGWMLGFSKLLGQTGANIAMIVIMLPLCVLLGGLCSAVMDLLVKIGVSEMLTLGLYLIFLGVLLFAVLGLMMAIRNKNNRNDNTSGVIAVLECAALAAKDETLKGKCCFILFDNEEWGLIGSAAHAKWCRKNGVDTAKQLVVNIDCVGVGEKLVAARTGGESEAYKAFIGKLRESEPELVEKRSCLVYMSDHANFKQAFMLSRMDRSAFGPLYIPNIHTNRDRVCDVALVTKLADEVMQTIRG